MVHAQLLRTLHKFPQVCVLIKETKTPLLGYEYDTSDTECH